MVLLALKLYRPVFCWCTCRGYKKKEYLGILCKHSPCMFFFCFYLHAIFLNKLKTTGFYFLSVAL
ncbi:MAG: SWIM zinc finger family protein [Rickettsiales bacterium]|nr:SWIM zinc finger family protein [Rickettsiales bacterium]